MCELLRLLNYQHDQNYTILYRQLKSVGSNTIQYKTKNTLCKGLCLNKWKTNLIFFVSAEVSNTVFLEELIVVFLRKLFLPKHSRSFILGWLCRDHKPYSSLKWTPNREKQTLPCHILLIVLSPQETVVLSHHIQISLVFRPVDGNTQIQSASIKAT